MAKLVPTPVPDLLSLANAASGLQKGIEERGDLAIVLTGVDPTPKVLTLVPGANFLDFFAALNVNEPATHIVEVQLGGDSKFVGRKGDYAALSTATDRGALEQLFGSDTGLASDTSLAAWVGANKALSRPCAESIS
ncbi:MAG TPA: hypothetical protein VGM76_01515 [Lacipirellulaceae bacterium]